MAKRQRVQRGPKPPTIIDVAKRAQVSKTVASDALRSHGNVSEAAQAAVLKAAKELHYHPNAAARTLVRQRSQTIGVVVSDLHNPFFGEVVEGVSEVAERLRMSILLTTGLSDQDREIRALETLIEARCDGLVVISPQPDGSSIRSVTPIQPTVIVGQPIEQLRIDQVYTDEHRGVAIGVEHLIELGHREIAHVNLGEGVVSLRRSNGYRASMDHAGLIPRIFHGGNTEEAGVRAVAEILRGEPRPTALVMANDLSALGALAGLNQAGLSVPEDMSVVGFDNIEFVRSSLISLTTINQPRREMGRIAASMITEQLLGQRSQPRAEVVAPSLLVRRTTGAPPSS